MFGPFDSATESSEGEMIRLALVLLAILVVVALVMWMRRP